jgi:hypothetical protein
MSNPCDALWALTMLCELHIAELWFYVMTYLRASWSRICIIKDIFMPWSGESLKSSLQLRIKLIVPYVHLWIVKFGLCQVAAQPVGYDMYTLAPKTKAKLTHGDMNEISRLWVYLKDGIRYQFLFGILGILERWYMLLDFPQSFRYTWKTVYVTGSKQNKNKIYAHVK